MSWSPTGFALTNVNGKTTGAVTIDTVDGSNRFYPTSVLFEVMAATLITVPPTVSVGSNSPSFNDIVAATSLTGLTALNKTVVMNLTAAAFTSVAAGGTLGINVTVGATATTCTLKVMVVGFYA